MGKLKSHNEKFSEHHSATYIVLKKSKPFSVTSSALYLQMKFFFKKRTFSPKHGVDIPDRRLSSKCQYIHLLLGCGNPTMLHAALLNCSSRLRWFSLLTFAFVWPRKVKSEQLSR